MNVKTKTALISTGLNVLLGVLKLVLFAITGSLAILAEAWHSLADVGTSLLVLLAVTRRQTAGTEEAEGDPETTSPSSLLKTAMRRLNAEHWAGLVIGVLLSAVAIGLLRKVLLGERAAIQQPVLSGILFLVFAVGSYFVYRYETSVGQAHGSVGLISDGLHSKADMVGALLAGSAMILYALGVDLDRPVALLISLFVLCFGFETLVMTILSAAGGALPTASGWRTLNMLAVLTDRDRLRHLVLRLEDRTRVPLLDRLRRIRGFVYALRWAALAIPVVAVLGSCLYVVGVGQQAILLRLGRPVGAGQPIESGLHLKLPWPIDRPIVVDTHAVRRLNVANSAASSAFALLWTQEHGSEEAFLSGDNNFFYPYIVVHYRIKDVFAYLTSNANPEDLLDSVSHRHVTSLFASLPFDEIVGDQRGQLETRIQAEIQRTLDDLESGIDVVDVLFRDVHPPIFIADAFENVIAARQEKEELINAAEGYRNQKIPEAGGAATRAIEQAEGYSVERVDRACGDAGRFVARVIDDRLRRRITLRRLYLESIQDAMTGAGVVLVDPSAGTPTLLLGKGGAVDSLIGSPVAAFGTSASGSGGP